MSTVEMKTQIYDYVEQLQDDNFVQAIHAMLDAYVSKQKDPVIGYDINGKPKYASEMQKKYEEGVEAIKRGEGGSLEEMKAKLKPNGIETIDLQYGVSLEEIKKRQTINKITFEELQEMPEGEEWKQTLDELIESID